ncbi:MAG: endonuclease/exonuclease/phosphatase family protein [bacterium]
MNRRLIRFLSTFAFGALYSLYAAGLLLVWFIAHHFIETPSWRLATSIVSDLVWLPLGMVVWAEGLRWAASPFLRGRRRVQVVVFVLAYAVSACGHLLWPEPAFKLLLLPMLAAVVKPGLRWRRSPARSRWLIRYLPVAVVFVATLLYYGWQLVPNGGGARPGDLKVMTYNILADANPAREEQALACIKQEAPDVLCCQEYSPRFDESYFARELAMLYPYRAVCNIPANRLWSGGAIYSRYPLQQFVPSGWDTVSGGNREFVFAELQLGHRTINIVNFHLLNCSSEIDGIKERGGNPFVALRHSGGADSRFSRVQYRQALFLVGRLNRFRDSTILCGDLNDTPNSTVFHTFGSKTVNAFSRKGWGLGATFGAEYLHERFEPEGGSWTARLVRDVLRIDHIFVTPGLEVVSARVVGDAPGSDHKPLVAVVRVGE